MAFWHKKKEEEFIEKLQDGPNYIGAYPTPSVTYVSDALNIIIAKEQRDLRRMKRLMWRNARKL